MRIPLIVAVLAVGACNDPVAPLAGERYVLRQVNGATLPASQTGFNSQVLADTLVFGVESSKWRPSPLARAVRQVRYLDGRVAFEEWWYTYEFGTGGSFPIRGLCADGDLARPAAGSASCIDSSGTATMTGDELVISFRVLGTLRYQRVGTGA